MKQEEEQCRFKPDQFDWFGQPQVGDYLDPGETLPALVCPLDDGAVMAHHHTDIHKQTEQASSLLLTQEGQRPPVFHFLPLLATEPQLQVEDQQHSSDSEVQEQGSIPVITLEESSSQEAKKLKRIDNNARKKILTMMNKVAKEFGIFKIIGQKQIALRAIKGGDYTKASVYSFAQTLVDITMTTTPEKYRELVHRFKEYTQDQCSKAEETDRELKFLQKKLPLYHEACDIMAEGRVQDAVSCLYRLKVDNKGMKYENAGIKKVLEYQQAWKVLKARKSKK